jgi:poly(3-hydroxybutyrate) depolymerase
MLYQLYQAQTDLLTPWRRVAGLWAETMAQLPASSQPAAVRLSGSLAALFAGAVITHQRPPFGITSTVVDGRVAAVREEAVMATPFATLLRFAKEGVPAAGAPAQPKVLLVAPMSGHFATLLRATVQTMLPDCDVYITDWHNARDVKLSDGAFGFDDYVAHLIRFMEHLGPPVHIVAVCQPAVAGLVAASVMAAEKNRAAPATMTLMAGPIDARMSPTRVNQIAQQRSIEDYERQMIARVPARYAGAGRRVYPGFLQLTSFMAMNADRHINAHLAQLRRLFTEDAEGAAAHRRFYDEYFAVCDLPAEFYLETVQRVFQRHDLPRGAMMYRGARVAPSAIRRTALLVVEGERDDICGLGQTMAALELCTGIPASRKTYHLQTGAGHYGVFSGRAWATQIYPKLRAMISAA